MMCKLVLLPLLLLAACAAPKQHYFTNSEVIAAPYAQVWQQAVTVAATHNIPIKLMDVASGYIEVEPRVADGNGGYDCGMTGLAIPLQTMGALNLRLQPVQGGTQVTVTVSYNQISDLGGNSFVHPCTSTGVIESNWLRALKG